MKFYVGATNAYTGEAEYHLCTDGEAYDMAWMQASASMPAVSRPVPVGNKLMLDGCITDSVPFRYMESLGYNRNVIVLTQPEGYVKKDSALMPLMKAALKDYP